MANETMLLELYTILQGQLSPTEVDKMKISLAIFLKCTELNPENKTAIQIRFLQVPKEFGSRASALVACMQTKHLRP